MGRDPGDVVADRFVERDGPTTRFGALGLRSGDGHELTVVAEGLPTVHLDGARRPDGGWGIGRSRPECRLEVVGLGVGTLAAADYGFTRDARAVRAQVDGREWVLRRWRFARTSVVRTGNGRVAWSASSTVRLLARADAVDAAVAIALLVGVDDDELTFLSGM